MRPDIGYVILDYNPNDSPEANLALCKTIEVLYNRKNSQIKADIYVLNQSNNEDHDLWLSESRARFGFSLITMNRNLGISRALNYFARINKAPIMGFLSSDVVVTSGFDTDLLAKLDSDNDMYQVCPLVSKSEIAWHSLPQDASIFPFGGDKWCPTFEGGVHKTIATEFNCMFIKMSTFDKIGYFDERWKGAYENIDFGLRIYLAGGYTGISFDSFVWHYHQMCHKSGASQKTYDNYLNTKGYDHNLLGELWKKKWGFGHNEVDLFTALDLQKPVFYEQLKLKDKIFLPYNQEMLYE